MNNDLSYEVTRYASPTAGVLGKSPGVDTSSNILTVPGINPPINVPVGNSTLL